MFLMSYRDLVEVMLDLIHAFQKENWHLYLAAIKDFIPWSFAYNPLYMQMLVLVFAKYASACYQTS